MLRRSVWAAAIGIAVSVLAFGAVACGGDDDEDDGDAITPAATTAAPTTESDGGDGGGGDGVETLNITAADFSFDADASSVAAGSVVEVNFSNEGSATHTVNFYTDEDYSEAIPGAESGQTSAGESINFTFEAPESGSAFYRCEVHPSQMEGELAIE